MASRTEGEVLQVIKVTGQVKGYEVDKHALAKLLLDPRVINRKVMIVSMAGLMNSGKSFLVNIFLKYLTNIGNNDWINLPCDPLAGFDWGQRGDDTTTGIVMWSEPFIITHPSGEEICILLMETQSFHNLLGNLDMMASMFSLHTKISSVQIYNFRDSVTSGALSCLKKYAMYGNCVKEDSNDKPFQSLWLLVRDWVTYPIAFEGGNNYLNNIREKSLISDGKSKLESVATYFESLQCFLMPIAPDRVDFASEFDGNLLDNDVPVEFKTSIKAFTEHIFNPKNMVTKKFLGKEVTGKELYEYIKLYVKALKNIPLLKDDEFVETPGNVLATQKTISYYKEMMDKRSGTSYVSEKDFEKAYTNAMKKFKQLTKRGIFKKQKEDKALTSRMERELKKVELVYKKDNEMFTAMAQLRPKSRKWFFK